MISVFIYFFILSLSDCTHIFNALVEMLDCFSCQTNYKKLELYCKVQDPKFLQNLPVDLMFTFRKKIVAFLEKQNCIVFFKCNFFLINLFFLSFKLEFITSLFYSLPFFCNMLSFDIEVLKMVILLPKKSPLCSMPK